MSPSLPAKRPPLATSPFNRDPEPVDARVFEVDHLVTHDRRGLGRVVRVHGERIEVRFGPETVSFALPCSKLHQL